MIDQRQTNRLAPKALATVSFAALAVCSMPVAHATAVLGFGGSGNPTPTNEQIAERLNGLYANDPITVVTTPEGFTGIESEQAGQVIMDAAIKAAYAADPTQPIVVSTYSQSAAIAEMEKQSLLTDPDAPPASAVTFVELGNPDRADSPGVVSSYTTIDVSYEYDPISRPVDDVFNGVADANAVASLVYDHMGGTGALGDLTNENGYTNVDLSTIPADDITTSGNVTYYTAPEPNLPLLQPLRDMGVPASVLAPINAALKPIVDAGYSTTPAAATVKTIPVTSTALAATTAMNVKANKPTHPPSPAIHALGAKHRKIGGRSAGA
jgi:hypothetical protein